MDITSSVGKLLDEVDLDLLRGVGVVSLEL